ncbi:MAG: Holliday junction resolvase RuvX [Desulfovibrio sp.]|nr:Holliday junction resolvase RuvX [Desulfovibrio sp.]
MRFFCIDYGLERTGLAVSDPSAHLAFPLKTLRLADYQNRKQLLDALADCIRESDCSGVVLGLPMPLEGGETMICRQIRNIAKRLAHRITIPIYFMNEALTSEMALSFLQASRVRVRKRKAILDQEAAVCILESFLERYHKEGDTFLARALFSNTFSCEQKGDGVLTAL